MRPPAVVNRTNIIHMRTSVSRRLNILCIMFKIIAFFIIMLFNRLYVRVGILPTYENHFHDRIISLRGQVWAHKTSLTPPLFINVSVPSLKSERSCICVLGYQLYLYFTILIFDFEFFRQCVFFVFFFILFSYYRNWRSCSVTILYFPRIFKTLT